jgi:hypothetical protein
VDEEEDWDMLRETEVVVREEHVPSHHRLRLNLIHGITLRQDQED